MLSAVHFVRRMSVFLLVFGYLWSPLRAETQVSCVFNESCVLPCSFQNGSDPVIHWFKTPGDDRVHSYYYDQDQVQHQDQDFKDRTSLFVDQISRGNASLLLREVRVQDEGTYKCFTSTVTSDGKNFFINLRVKASVSFVNIEQRGDELICSSKDIYPKPDVSWSLRPPPPDVEPKTSVSVSEKGLYSIFSSVPLSHKPPEEHSCNISTDHSWSSATYRPQYSSDSRSTVYAVCGVLFFLFIPILCWKHLKDFQDRRVLKKERKWTKDRHLNLLQELQREGAYPKPPLTRASSDRPEQLRKHEQQKKVLSLNRLEETSSSLNSHRETVTPSCCQTECLVVPQRPGFYSGSGPLSSVTPLSLVPSVSCRSTVSIK